MTMPKPLTVWITTNSGKFFKRWEAQANKQIDFIKIIVMEYLSFKDWSISIKWFCLRLLSGEVNRLLLGWLIVGVV